LISNSILKASSSPWQGSRSITRIDVEVRPRQQALPGELVDDGEGDLAVGISQGDVAVESPASAAAIPVAQVDPETVGAQQEVGRVLQTAEPVVRQPQEAVGAQAARREASSTIPLHIVVTRPLVGTIVVHPARTLGKS
jgi:hypothetical protein